MSKFMHLLQCGTIGRWGVKIGIVAFAYGRIPIRASGGKSHNAIASASPTVAYGVKSNLLTKSGFISVTNNTRSRIASREI